jgi:tRNA A37 methylthiotransferase MiaB
MNVKTACIAFAQGCPRNVLNAVTVMRLFKANGWNLTTKFKNAELILVLTCGFDAISEAISLKYLSITKKKMRSRARLCILGCLCEIDKTVAASFDAIAIGYCDPDGVDALIDGKIKYKDMGESHILHKHISYLRGSFSRWDFIKVLFYTFTECPQRLVTYFKPGYGPRLLLPWYEKSFHIRVEKGCLGACTYCAIRFAAGQFRSQSLKEIESQLRQGLKQGYQLFRLLGEDVGAYGLDRNSNITELLKCVFSINENFRVVIEDLSPKWLIRYWNDFCPIIEENEDRIHHIVIPVQSGSPDILSKMKRGYSVKEIKKAIQELHTLCPNLSLATHMVVGYPGETERNFRESIDFLKICHFERILAHRYTDRPNTKASKLTNKVPDRVKIERLWRLRRIFPKSCVIRI